jgi:hypothetical protein
MGAVTKATLARAAALAVAVWSAVAAAQSPFELPKNAISGQVVPYDEAWAKLQQQDKTRPRAVLPARREGDKPTSVPEAILLGTQQTPTRLQ